MNQGRKLGSARYTEVKVPLHYQAKRLKSIRRDRNTGIGSTRNRVVVPYEDPIVMLILIGKISCFFVTCWNQVKTECQVAPKSTTLRFWPWPFVNLWNLSIGTTNAYTLMRYWLRAVPRTGWRCLLGVYVTKHYFEWDYSRMWVHLFLQVLQDWQLHL